MASLFLQKKIDYNVFFSFSSKHFGKYLKTYWFSNLEKLLQKYFLRSQFIQLSGKLKIP